MNVNLDIFELSYLLDACLRGSHLRSMTIDKFTDLWFDKLSEQQRYNLYEWSLRITYNGDFKPSDTCCGCDIKFMKRYDPLNQYMITTEYNGKTEKHRAYLMDGEYFLTSTRSIAKEYITCVLKFVPEGISRSEFEINCKGRRN